MATGARHTISKVLVKGKLIIVYDDIRTKVGMLGGIAEKVSPYAVNQMIRIGKGLVYVCITEEKANQLELPLMTSANNDSDKTFTVSVDHLKTTTGISAFERSHTIESFTFPQTASSDFRRPGHIFPIIAKRNGLLERIGIAEALMELCLEASALPVAYACEVLNSDGEIANRSQIEQLAKNHQIPIILMSELEG